MDILNVPQGEFQLSRYPLRKNELLRAWDAADEYLLNHLSTLIDANNFSETESNNTPETTLRLLLINDSFGALSLALAQHHVTVWTDSFLSQQGILENLSRNEIVADNIQILNSLESPAGEVIYDYVLIKIPKSLALLEEQLIRIKPSISSSTQIIAAAMVKSIHTSTLKLFEKYIGVTKTSLARKKARLIFAEVDLNIKEEKSPYPKSYVLEETEHTIINHANVFSRESLDIGTRFFLQQLPANEKYKKIIDLACGNGVVGLIAAEKNPCAEMLFLDESFMAVASAKETIEQNTMIHNRAQFKVNDCLSGIEKNSADLILNNPPFHLDNAIGDDVAWQMFTQSYSVLKQGGELWVVGNGHLGYHIKLKKIFGHCETIATNKKFVILKAIKK
jgi:16S rRNA (guanine1207-N2)-methyltransferase